MFYLYLTQEQFEYDIRGIIMAFNPGVEIKTIIMDQQPNPCDGAADGQEAASQAKEAGQALAAGQKAKTSSIAEENQKLADGQTATGSRTKEVGQALADCQNAAASQVMKVVYKEHSFEVELTGPKPEHKTWREEVVLSTDDRRDRKTEVKNCVYQMLSKAYERELVWGTLTGIRPTKIAMEMLEQGMTQEQITEQMEQQYLVSHKKAALSAQIVTREQKLLEKIDYENGYSLYIGIPFCPTTCLYCSFTSYPLVSWKNRVDQYLDSLIYEMDALAKICKGRNLNTVYIGGGTPTTLSAQQLDRLISAVEQHFDFSYLQEFTVEAGRPDSVTMEKLQVLRNHHISRISINPQTMKDETLKIIGRRHTVAQVKEAYQMAREAGFDNINMDIILGLPDETDQDVEHTMEALCELNPDNITVHSLALKRAARLNIEKDKYQVYSYKNSDETMEITDRYARTLDMTPYYLYRQKNMAGNLENVGYAKAGKAGIYNILIMEEKQTIVALGAGATTKVVYPQGRIERAENVKDVGIYMERIDEMIERKHKLLKELAGFAHE